MHRLQYSDLGMEVCWITARELPFIISIIVTYYRLKIRSFAGSSNFLTLEGLRAGELPSMALDSGSPAAGMTA